MPLFEIEQYEIHSNKYRVTANDPAEAITLLLDGAAESVEGSLEYIEIAEDLGLAVEDCHDLAIEVSILGVPVNEHFIPSIRSISIVNESVEQTPTNEAERQIAIR